MDQYIGRLLDNRYEILEIIGTGGMAVVYKARCHRLNRLVAIKILKDEFSGDEEFRRRFRAEGEAVASLSHPNIVQVYDVSSSPTCNFIVMELIDGISLKQYMQVKGVLNWKETLHFSMQIAEGLEHAHSRGIIHRDIKPHNVMVLKNGSVKVMDFGIARVMSKSSTLTKEALGSVHYISPEQAKGGYTDNRSDLYSLAVVMYEMMTGRPPYDGESPVAVAIQHINGGAVRPSSLNPNIPVALEQIILKGMALNPADRYGSAAEMLRDMEQFRLNPDMVFQYAAPLSEPTRPIPTAGQMLSRSQQGQAQRVPSRNPEPVRKARAAAGQSQRKRKSAQKPQRKPKRSRMVTVAIVTCSLVAVLALVMLMMAIFNGALLKQDEELVDVPFLIGQTYKDGYLDQYEGLVVRLQPQQYNENFAKGQIMQQQPAGGNKVVPGTELWITVSMGKEPKLKTMDNLVDVDIAQAQTLLEGQGYRLIVRYDTSDTYESGQVIRTEPSAGSTLVEGQTVNLWVSTGPKVILKRMPDVIGHSREDAEKVLNSLGFETITVTEVESDQPIGSVVYQSEPKYKELDVKTQISLEVSKGPGEDVQTAPMIKVVGFSKEVALQELNKAGFYNYTMVEIRSKRQIGRVVTQSIPEGKEVPVDSLLTLEISRGNAEGEGTKVTFSLPLKDTDFVLSIFKNGKEVVESVEIPAGQTEYTVELSGHGNEIFELRIDGEFYQNQKVMFADD